jgi:hypothetical protein
MSTVDGLGQCRETSGDDDMPVAFGFQCQFAHRFAFRLLGFILSNASSSRSLFLARATRSMSSY